MNIPKNVQFRRVLIQYDKNVIILVYSINIIIMSRGIIQWFVASLLKIDCCSIIIVIAYR